MLGATVKPFLIEKLVSSTTVKVGLPIVPGDVLSIEVACLDGEDRGIWLKNAVYFFIRLDRQGVILASDHVS